MPIWSVEHEAEAFRTDEFARGWPVVDDHPKLQIADCGFQ
jgi:hypothetical protein